MRPDAIRFGRGISSRLHLLLIAPQAVAMDAAALPRATAGAMAQAASPQAIAEYRASSGLSGSARGVRAGGQRLLELDCREAARPQRQTA